MATREGKVVGGDRGGHGGEVVIRRARAAQEDFDKADGGDIKEEAKEERGKERKEGREGKGKQKGEGNWEGKSEVSGNF